MLTRNVTKMSAASVVREVPGSRFEFSVRSMEVVGVAHDEEYDLYLVATRNNVVVLL